MTHFTLANAKTACHLFIDISCLKSAKFFLCSLCECVWACLMWICIIFCRSKCKFNMKCYNGLFFFFLFHIEHWLKKATEFDGNLFFFFHSDKVNKSVCKNGKFTLFTKFISHIWLTVKFNFMSLCKSAPFCVRFLIIFFFSLPHLLLRLSRFA